VRCNQRRCLAVDQEATAERADRRFGLSLDLRQGPPTTRSRTSPGPHTSYTSIAGDLAGSPIRASPTWSRRRRANRVRFPTGPPVAAATSRRRVLALATHTQLTHVPYKGQRARARRPARRPAHFHVRHRHHLASANPRRKVACVRGVEARNAPRPFRRCRHAGGGHQALRHLPVAGRARAGRNVQAIVDRLNLEIARAMPAPDVRERLVSQGGNEIVTGSPEDLAALIKSDLRLYAKLVKDAKIPAQ